MTNKQQLKAPYSSEEATLTFVRALLALPTEIRHVVGVALGQAYIETAQWEVFDDGRSGWYPCTPESKDLYNMWYRHMERLLEQEEWCGDAALLDVDEFQLTQEDGE